MNNNHPPMPKTYLVESILATIFCCMPLGIVGLIYASGVASAYYSGNYVLAQHKSDEAKKWTKWSFLLGVVYMVFWVAILVICVIVQDAHVFKSHPGMP